MSTDWVHMMRDLFDQGFEMEEVLKRLRDAGASQYHSVLALKEVKQMKMFDADQVVINSMAWRDTRDNMIAFRKDMTKFFKDPSTDL